MFYRSKTRKDGDTILVTFPDFPEAATFGEDEDDALMRAIGAIETAIEMRIADKEDIPAPRLLKGRGKSVRMPTLTCLKVELYREMRRQGVTKANLTRMLHSHPAAIDRLLDVSHKSQMGQLDAAFAALGRRVEVEIRPAGY